MGETVYVGLYTLSGGNELINVYTYIVILHLMGATI